MRRIPIIPLLCVPVVCTALVLAPGTSVAQNGTMPAPAQAGDDPSMAQPRGSTQPAQQQQQPVHNPESTVGLAPAEQPVNNLKPRVAGEVVPSSQETAAHNDSIFEHDQQPILTHTFNFTADQQQAIVAALAQEKDTNKPGKALELQETVVVPRGIKLKPIPEQIAQEFPWVKPYLYLKSGNRIAIVDPHLRYVAAIIE
ncbi:MAG: hypothetical protein AB7V13_02175 [Pseudorhodoplanes sp.]|uniref:hypothetical protein n=1 Tax=Pseudorhodoplanes sp. TaxID=1934341 RepID=UPI003D0F6E27